MKKIVLFILLLSAIIFKSQAQPACNVVCTYGPLKTYIYEVCHHYWSGNNYLGYPDIIDCPSVFVMVNYRIMDCNGVQSIQIDGTVLFDNRDLLNDAYRDYIGPGVLLTFSTYTPACTFTPSIANIRQAQLDAIDKLVASLGIPNDLDVYYSGACNSLVKITWPAGAFQTYPLGSTTDTPNPGGAGLDTIKLGGCDSYRNVPCDDACCKVKYTYTIITNEVGLTNASWVPTYSPVNVNLCETAPLPNYNTLPDRMEATVIDPITGNATIVYGTVIGQDACKLVCNKYDAPPPPASFTTDVAELSKEAQPLEFSANPTLVNNFIKFNSNKPIQQVSVYNMSGKKIMTTSVLENNELSTTELKSGMYFIQVYFNNSVVKTIKIMKQ